ncbi:hypothetical protein DFH29DRAFT_876470 [Suillus ampliporus]|nr:hypothetical protein DFH29DRAFT_876470 [Suillus ampliporus]
MTFCRGSCLAWHAWLKLSQGSGKKQTTYLLLYCWCIGPSKDRIAERRIVSRVLYGFRKRLNAVSSNFATVLSKEAGPREMLGYWGCVGSGMSGSSGGMSGSSDEHISNFLTFYARATIHQS